MSICVERNSIKTKNKNIRAKMKFVLFAFAWIIVYTQKLNTNTNCTCIIYLFYLASQLASDKKEKTNFSSPLGSHCVHWKFVWKENNIILVCTYMIVHSYYHNKTRHEIHFYSMKFISIYLIFFFFSCFSSFILFNRMKEKSKQENTCWIDILKKWY